MASVENCVYDSTRARRHKVWSVWWAVIKDNIKYELFGNVKSNGMDMYGVKGNMVGNMQGVTCEYSISVKNYRERKGEIVYG